MCITLRSKVQIWIPLTMVGEATKSRRQISVPNEKTAWKEWRKIWATPSIKYIPVVRNGQECRCHKCFSDSKWTRLELWKRIQDGDDCVRVKGGEIRTILVRARLLFQKKANKNNTTQKKNYNFIRTGMDCVTCHNPTRSFNLANVRVEELV